jgi:hypothetical protein
LDFAKDELALTRSGNLVRICFLSRLADVPESAGWLFDVLNKELRGRKADGTGTTGDEGNSALETIHLLCSTSRRNARTTST